MSREDDFDRGLKNRRAVLGDAWVDKSTAGANGFNAEFQSFITRYAWHDIWGRPGLDHTTRRLLVLGMTMGLARWEEFELHCRAAIRGGVPVDTIKETLMQGAIYCGVPAANTAFKITGEILKEEGLLPGPAPLVAGPRVQTHHTFSQPQLHVALQGAEAGVPVVLAHALGLDLSMWDGLAAELGKSHPVLRYDHRGHGGSAVPAGPYALDDLVDDAARLIREWGRGPVVFIGLSMGGMVAQGLAIRHPELVKRVVLANTAAQYPDAAKAAWTQRIAAVQQGGMAAVADMVVQRYLHEGFRNANPGVAQGLREQILRSDAAGYVASCYAVMSVDWLEQLSKVQCPALVIAGAHDVGATPAMAQAIAQAIPGATLKVFDDASHLSVAEQPQAFADAVKAFIA
ncbi:MAG TPA: alpha/beta fold hydrolase [Burkholderiaceae bacterium]|jgi:3-oxoadipate enol-lactonase|nr:alpha/beta fold hydrolase [Burkholderiaceae bacterium]